MRELIDRVRAYVRQRTPRERWLAALALCALSFIFVWRNVAAPLDMKANQLDHELIQLRGRVEHAERLSGSARRLQAELSQVEKLIQTSEKTDLFTLLESLATEAGFTSDQLDSLKPRKPATGEEGYPETRVEVRLKGATLTQIVALLHKIETARLHMIVRSLRISTRGKDEQVLDVNFSVSSFERA